MNQWVLRITGGITAVLTLAVAPVVRGAVLINEIMYHPPPAIPEAPSKEWIELYNNGTNAVDLTGWRFTKGISFAFTNGTLAPGAYLVVAANRAVFATNYPSVTNVIGDWTGKLRNSGDTLELQDALGQTVNKASYANEGDWAQRRAGDPYPGQPTWWVGWKWTTPADGLGKSIELLNASLPNNIGQNWAPSLIDNGTPGQPNSVATNHIAPIIADVRHLPAVPRATNTVTVTARIIQETGTVSTVSLFYRVDGISSFSSVPMFDDGAHGDAAANDGVYGAALPAQPDRTVVEFYVQARDGAGRIRTWPAPSDDAGTQAANALYQVDENSYSGSQPLYRFITKASEWNTWLNLMDNVTGGQFSDAQMNGALVRIDGAGTDVRYCVGLRNRGAGTRAAHPHNLHLAIPADHPVDNITHLDFNTRDVHCQVAGNALFSAANVLNAYGAPVQVRVNGANLANASPGGGTDTYQFGSYYCFQPYDSDWARAHVPLDSGGNIYKGIWYFDGIKLINGADIAWLGTNVALYRNAYSPTGPTASTGAYVKESNTAEDDWSDLLNLCFALSTNTPAANFFTAASQVANIDQWLSYFAVNSLVLNMETTLATGVGDDFSLYRGLSDPRFQVLNHDLDTVLGQGDVVPDYTMSIFKATNLPAIGRFLKNPDIAPRYYAVLKQLADTTFSSAQLGPVLDQNLGGWVPNSYIQAMKDATERRRTNLLAQIPLQLSIKTGLSTNSGYLYTTASTVSLNGNANALTTRTVLVNGATATYVPWQASWSISGVTLLPGINRITVQALDANSVEIDHATVDIWYNNGTTTTVGGTISGNTTWTAAAGPYNVSSSVTVANGATLTIEPGTTLYLAPGVNVTVANGGRILAQGTPSAGIRFTVAPGSGANWGGLTINGGAGSPETVIAYTHFESNSTICIEVAAGTVNLDHLTFATTTHQYLALDGASFVVSHCTFPTATTAFELVHGTQGIKAGGRGIVRHCFFGAANGYNDVMDFTGGNRDLIQPIIQYFNNVFIGSGDDLLDLDGTDAWIEGNIFLHVHKNGAPDSSSGISGGDYDFGSGAGGVRTSEITVVRNIFFDCDQAATAKQGNFYTMLNNTIVHTSKTGGTDIESGVVNMQDAIPTPATTYGRGCYLEGNIIVDAEALVRNYNASASVVTFTNNLMPFAWAGPGGGNSTNDPMLTYIPQISETQFSTWEKAQIMWDWFTPRSGSPAKGSGPNGTDMGACIPSGVSISGEPPALTTATGATLNMAFLRTGNGIPTDGFPEGSGYTHYKWRLDGGAWSAATPIGTPLALTSLPNGTHQVQAVGRRDSGWYQDAAELGEDGVISTSRTWQVDTTWRGLVINELLADNHGSVPVNDTAPDVIELYNAGLNSITLTGMGLTDSSNLPPKFIFPAACTIGPGQFFVLYADNNPGTNHTGFALNKSGGSVYLFDTAAAGSVLIDAVTYGLQLPDLSIGRLPSGQWGLTRPTFGAPNVAVSTADAHRVRINEWLAASAANPDFIELYNPDPVPADLGGCYLTDNPIGWPARNPIPPLSFLPANGLQVFLADGQSGSGADHLNFKLDYEWGALALVAPDLSIIDQVVYGPQTADVSMGRSPNGGSSIISLPTPTPGLGNPGGTGSGTISNITIHLMSYTQTWKYNQTNNLDAVNWTATNYNDAPWPSGQGLLAFENNSLITPLIKTTLIDPRVPTNGMLSGHAYYFRTALNISNDLTGYTITATYRCDDGAIIYTNGGGALQRIRVPAGTITNSTLATTFPPDSSSDAVVDETFTFPGTALRLGTNFFAVSVHQQNTNSSDIVWGLALDASRTVTNYPQGTVVLNEIMANNGTVTNTDGTVTDWIELYNPTATGVNMSGFTLNDDPAKPNPHQWTFPAGVSIASGARLLVRFDPASPASTNLAGPLNAGFGLDSSGDKLLLYQNASLVDAVTFGIQARDFSIARIPEGTGAWTLALPTPLNANLSASVGNTYALRFNEWMADPQSGDDWFELYNPNAQPVALGGFCLTDDLTKPTQYTIPPLSFMGAGPFGAYVLFHADGNTTAGPTHTPFKLSASGEALGLFSADGAQCIDAITFGQQTKGVSEGFFPDGSTNLIRFARTPTPGSANYLPFTDILINEALSRTADGSQSIELFNQTDQAVDLSGAWLSDDLLNPKKFRLPDPTILQPGAFTLFDQTQFNPLPGRDPSFGLDPVNGSDLYLSLADSAGNLTGYRTSVEFGGADTGMAFGQFETSVQPEFVAMPAATPGSANPYPAVGPVVINEIHYHPPPIGTNDNTADEFIELLNITGSSVPFYDPLRPTNTWHIRNAVSFNFPTNTTLAPGAFLLLVSFDPAADSAAASAFRSKFGVPPGTALFGPWSGKLDNGNESIELNRPGTPLNGATPRVLVERIQYADSAPWPTAPDGTGTGTGISLQRRNAALFGNDPVNWLAGAPTAGTVNGLAAGSLPAITSQPADQLVTPGSTTTFSVVATGTAPLDFQWRLNGLDILDATNSSLTVTNIGYNDTGRYSVRVSNPYGCVLSGTARLQIQSAPAITRQPAGAVNYGAPFAFNVVARGTDPLSYQWRRSNTNLLGATTAQLAFPSPRPSDAGDYSVVIANNYGSVTSVLATLSVTIIDSDLDGMPDWWEIANGTNPYLNDANADPDNDGMTNLQEYWSGTDPMDSGSALRLTATPQAGGSGLVLSFVAAANHAYTIQFQTGPGAPWLTFTRITPAPGVRLIQLAAPTQPDARVFYRLVTWPAS